ncbi:MAG TPA: exodeoxyribonuclease VII large subunit, partial [Opitutales bacterium]|nr:exodeoxyribonuclease VII large subunit [Opitutales bacterium]
MNDGEKTPVVSVSQLTQAIKSVLESGFSTVWVRGEVSNFKRHSSGHLYFTLKDEKAQISAAMFRSDAIRCPIALRDGMQVVAMGNISVYEQRGNYQILVRDIMEEGLGKLQAEFEKLKRKLEAEGLFSADRKKNIPTLPRIVGIVTSPTGAAIRDFIS